MTEDEARQKIQNALNKLRDNRSPVHERSIKPADSSVNYHIDNILEADGGQWNETVAQDYIQNLEAQIEDEIQAAHMNDE
jgi:hypothetical protein